MGDVNSDGHADLVVANQGSNTVSVLLGNGNGTFQPRTDYATGTTPAAVVLGDFNGDGKLDIATANFGANAVSLLLGNGDGTFRPRTDIALSATPVSLVAGDLNGDGKLDLAVATEDLSNDYVNLLRGNGDGTFQAPTSTITDSAPKGISLTLEAFSTISARDFNGDGRLDLVVVNNKDSRSARNGLLFAGGAVSVLLGNGDGTLQAPRITTVGSSPRTVAVGDFNGDGRPDFAVGNYISGNLSVLMNAGGGAFSTTSITAGGAPLSLATGDFNGDGRSDLAVSVLNLGGVTILSGQAGGTLQTTATYLTGGGFLAAGDVNGDGHPDLIDAALPDFAAVVVPAANTVSLFLNNGTGGFPAPVLIANPGVSLSSQATVDFNGDGIPDVALASGQVELGLGDGNFGDVTNVVGGTGVAVSDVDGNGTPDLLVGSLSFPPGEVALLLNSPGWDSRTGGAVGFAVSAPQQLTAGSPLSVTVTAVDALGNPVAGFLGTVDLDLRQSGSTTQTLAGQYSFTAADAGRHSFLVPGLTSAGADSISAFAAAMPAASVSFTVVPAALARFAFAMPASVTAGTPFSFTISAEDTYGNLETGYTGTVHFSASIADAQAVVPGDSTFTAANAGVHTFSATLFKTFSVLSQTVPSLTARDTTSGISSTAFANVLSLAPSSLIMTGSPNQVVAGTQDGVIVAARDVYGNVATGYAGTVHFTSTDPSATLPADYTFSSIDQGWHLFYTTLKTAGTQSFTVADTANPAFTSTESGIVVSPASPTVWVVTGLPGATTAGAARTFTLTAEDAYGNVVKNYFGMVHFSSSDGQASLPADYTFTAADAGSHAFTAILKTAGTQSLTFNDTVNTAFTGTRSLTVTPAAAASLVVTGFPATTAGVAHGFTVTARDAFGNVATGYTGTVVFSSSDPIASLPANSTFTAADAGVHTFTAALKRAGTQFIQAMDTVTGSIIGAENGIAVTAAAVSHFAISGPTSVTQGVGFKITVSAVDDFGNVNAGYRGTVHLSSTDATGGTQNFTFSNNDNGVHIFSYTFNALGFQTLTIVDTTNSSIVGSIVVDVLPKA